MAIALLGLLLPLSAGAQEVHFEVFSVEEGLCQSQVATVTQDGDGYLWLGTMQGVSRFDGVDFKSYNRTLGLQENYITASHADDRGRIWFGHPSGGLSLFENGQLTGIPPQPEWEGSLITSIMHDESSRVWIGTRGGGILVIEPDGPGTAVHQLTNQIPKVYELSRGTHHLWVGTAEGLFTATYPAAGDTSALLTAVDGELLREQKIVEVYEDRDGRIWLATGEEKVLLHIPAEVSASATARTIDLSAREELPPAYITDLTQDQQGDIWLATFGLGLWRLRVTGDDAIITDFESYTKTRGFPYDTVTDVEVDREGVVWIGTDGSGLTSYRGDAFQTYNTHEYVDQSCVWAIVEDTDGVFWFGTTAGLARCELSDERFGSPVIRHFLEDNGLPGQIVRDLRQDDQGYLWLAMEGTGIARFDPRTEQAVTLGEESGIPSVDLLSLVIDGTGTLWFGTESSGLFSYLPPSSGKLSSTNPGTFEHYPLGESDEGTAVWGMHVDGDGELWIGATDIGVGRFVTPEEGEARGSFEFFGPEQGLQHLALDCILEDHNGVLWVSADEGGLYSFDGQSFTPATDAAALIGGEDVYLVGCDRDNNIIAGTNRGLYKYDQVTGRTTRLGIKDGFRTTEFNVNATLVDRSGALWLGTVGGALRYDPRGIRPILEPPRTSITNLSVFLKPVGTEHGAVFEHDENHITFDFQGISLADPEGVRYQYRLKGFDADWISTTAERRFATYSRLPFRSYTFYVRSASGDGSWNQMPVSYSFTVNAPFWRTWWFYSLVALAIIGGTLGAFQWKTRSMARANRRLETNVRERTSELHHRSQELEEANVSLAAALESAKQASRAKATFLATMSHEIRTPLNGILGMTELLQDSPLDPGQQECAKAVSSSGKALLSILNDILDLSKIEAGRISIDQVPLRTRDVVMEVVNLFTAKLQQKNLDLAWCVSNRVPEEVTGDPYRLRQVLANLLGNAIKFTDIGTVTLHVEVEEIENPATGAESRLRLKFLIRDTGIGISDEGQAKLFQPFSQVHSFDARRHSGTGLGLAICRELCHLMGGEIDVSSEIGRGSCFSFSVEVEQTESTPPPQRLTGKRIVIVDDNVDQRQVVAEQIAQFGAETIECAQGDQIPGAKGPFDAVLVERENAMEDGLDLIQQLHRDDSFASARLILALPLGETLSEEVHAELPRLVTILKPIHATALEKLLLDPSDPVRDVQETAKVDRTIQWKGVRVLVVDDNQINRMVAIRMLKKMGCETESASDGLEAVDCVAREDFDVILMDCQMPVLNGYDATRTIRGIEGKSQIPVIALTANALRGDRDRCLEAGMDDYLSKPVSSDKLEEVLARWAARNPLPS